MVVQEKMMQSSTKPKSGPCTPITQLAQVNLRLALAGANAVRAVAVFSSCGGNITCDYADLFSRRAVSAKPEPEMP